MPLTTALFSRPRRLDADYIVETKTASYTTVNADLAPRDPKWIRFIVGTITIAPGTGTAADVGQVLYLRNVTGADATIVAGAGVTLQGLLTIEDLETLSLLCIGANLFDATGGK